MAVDLELGEDPLDLELLAEFFAALETGAVPSRAALEEAELALEPLRERCRRVALRASAIRAFAELEARHPNLSGRELAKLVERRTGAPAESVRRWVRGTENLPTDGGTVPT